MSNFGFVEDEWPELFVECRLAESYANNDARACGLYARRALEQLVEFVYEVAGLSAPYKDDLSARVNEHAFKNLAGPTVINKMNVIRKVGNAAAHAGAPLSKHQAISLVQELQHVVWWAAFHYSSAPDTLPRPLMFDVQALDSNAPPNALSQAEVEKLLATFAAHDAAIAKAKEENDDLQSQVARLQDQIAAAQLAKAAPTDDHDYDEASTRALIIDVLLGEAGWPLDLPKDREYEVQGMPNNQGVGYCDYVLWGADGLPLAVIEVKRTTRNPAEGQQQAKLYADCLEQQFGRRPVVFFTNGYESWLWDDASGYPPRPVQGFLTRDELELLIQRRQTRLTLATVAINPAIVERHYQHRAIRAIGEAFEHKQREALVVMATGAGKTRTVIALVEQMMKAGWVKRVLFLADRVALVNQAANAFKEHLPDTPPVNLVTEKVIDARVYVSTYPTMMGLINDTDGGLRRFGPGYFDLIVIDEAHRSVYQKYRSIFDWFDGLLVGLTATPKDDVDHNTYALFHLEDGVPTDAYPLDEAVEEGFLVPPVPVSVPVSFLRDGIRYDDRTDEEKDEWDSLEWGEDGDVPDAVDQNSLYSFVFNADTVDKVLETLMIHGHRVAGGDRLGKTIIFARNNDHAEFIRQRFDIAYPEYAGHFARVVTHKTEYAQSLIDGFSQPEKHPHIAISVDMLDTGIDVPDVVNLVFFKVIRSKSKFWQMIGRGTRLRPDLYGPGEHKANFYVFDFCQNLEFFAQDPGGSAGSTQKSLSQRLFELRLSLLQSLDAEAPDGGFDDADADATADLRGLRIETAQGLHAIVAGMNVDNFVVRPHREWIDKYDGWDAWRRLGVNETHEIVEHLAGLPSTVKDDDEQAKRYDVLILKLQLATLESDALTADAVRKQLQGIAATLLSQTSIPLVAAQQPLLLDLAGDEWWVDVTLPMLELARRRIRGLVQFIEKSKRAIVYTDFTDTLGEIGKVALPGLSNDFVRFREKARAYLRAQEDHVALQRLKRNKQLTPDDLSTLEQMLVSAGIGTPADVARASEESQGLGLFVRSLVGLERVAVQEAFSEFLVDSTYTANQIHFVSLIVSHLTENGILEPARLYESPFTDHAPQGPDLLFPRSEDVDGIIEILHQVRGHAVVESTVA